MEVILKREDLIRQIKDIDIELSCPNVVDKFGKRLSDSEYQTRRHQLVKRKLSLEKSLQYLPNPVREIDPLGPIRVKDSCKDREAAMIILMMYRAMYPNQADHNQDEYEAFESAKSFIRRHFSEGIHRKKDSEDAMISRLRGSFEGGKR
jgi:hypothetical protein